MEKQRIKQTSDGKLRFLCPGCGHNHVVNITPPNRPLWAWNGSLERPTLTPSVLETVGHYIPGHSGQCWCDYNAKHPEDNTFVCMRCHFFLIDGQLQFLTDCTHALAGQTVDLPVIE